MFQCNTLYELESNMLDENVDNCSGLSENSHYV